MQSLLIPISVSLLGYLHLLNEDINSKTNTWISLFITFCSKERTMIISFDHIFYSFILFWLTVLFMFYGSRSLEFHILWVLIWCGKEIDCKNPDVCIYSTSPPMSVLDMILNCIWCWGSNSGALGNIEYPFIVIIPKFILTQSGSTCLDPVYGSHRTIWSITILETI